jgi:hypothetical protein
VHAPHADTLDRAVADGFLEPTEKVILYSDGRYLHGTLECSNIRETITVSADAAVRATPPTWCSCRGIASTPFGQLLYAAHHAYKAIDDEAAGVLESSWPDIWSRLAATNTRYTEIERRPELQILEKRGRDASERIARTSAHRLGTHWLERSLAAQNLELPVTPETALMFSIWGRRRRVTDPQSGRPPSGIEHYYESHLTRALHQGAGMLVNIFTDPARPLGRVDLLDHGLVHELALLTWYHGIPAGQAGRIHLPEAAARGLAVVTGSHQRHRIGITRHLHETDENIETARVLWTDPDSDWSDFDEALDAARSL